MKPRVNLIWLGQSSPPAWPLGAVFTCEATVASVFAAMAQGCGAGQAEACLFWAERLGTPCASGVEDILRGRGDVWHAGLRLGTAGLPQAMDAVAPTWMLNRDPDPNAEATSWRISLEACLVRTDVLRVMGALRTDFCTLAGAALELGHRYIQSGVLIRHVPEILGRDVGDSPIRLPFEDELRFIEYRFGRFWMVWAWLRSILVRRVSIADAGRALLWVLNRPAGTVESAALDRARKSAEVDVQGLKVSVLIPTLDRYPYLKILLAQLRSQTMAAGEIIVVDQTPADRREINLGADFSDLPLRLIVRDRAGQCSSRNAGLKIATGDCILLLDDDVEIPPDLIERHVTRILEFGDDASSGVAIEDGAGSLPAAFLVRRLSDVFPAGNSLVRREALRRSGLFDPAFDRGSRADADLGMRLYLSGAVMRLNPDIRVLHRHAPVGGLRAHRSRVITYASSRQKLTHRNLVTPTEVYLARRYFSAAQVREALWLSALGTLALRGPWWRRFVKVALGVLLMPRTLIQIRRIVHDADALWESRVPVPSLPSSLRGEGQTC